LKKILIISSEPLRPADTLSSTFELSQAGILTRQFEVAIVSVYGGKSFLSACKQILRNLLKFKITGVGELLKIVPALLSGKRQVNPYTIDGIEVFEGIVSSFKTQRGFKEELGNWVKAGKAAFNQYVKVHGLPDLIHAHGRFLFAGVLAADLKRQHQLPFVYTEHSTFYRRGIAPEESRADLLEVYRESSAFIVVSAALGMELENFLAQKLPKAQVIANVLDPVFEEPVVHRNRSGRPTRFLTVASLDDKKGIDVLLKAFQQAFQGSSDVVLQIAGKGPLLHDLCSLRDQLGLHSVVHFLGSKPKQEIVKLMDEADCFVLPSRVETFGVVVIEALARGLPVVVTRSGGPELIVKEQCGLVVEPDDVGQLANALIEMQTGLENYHGLEIQQYALEQYGPRPFLNRMAQMYKTVMNDLHN
jgi:glycosyltransferase involved in cell wall biosynthesis